MLFLLCRLCSKNNGAITAHMEGEGIDFLQFAFRWVNCLLIREVPFAAALRLWDTYLAEGPHFNEFLVSSTAGDNTVAAFSADHQANIGGFLA
jgi:hypothetical protein